MAPLVERQGEKGTYGIGHGMAVGVDQFEVQL